jgi:hypothetical protein
MLSRQSHWLRAAFFALLGIAVTFIFLPPDLSLMDAYRPDTFQWSRAHSFLQQCVDPFRTDIEPAMRWRILPPLIARYLQLPGYTPLLIPWIGLIAAVAFQASVLQRRCTDACFVFGGTLLFMTTSAGLVPIHWFGMNDAWVWLGLLIVSFSNSWIAVVLACLLCPWVDERFIIGLPLSWFVRCLDQRLNVDQGVNIWNGGAVLLLSLAPYLIIRLSLGGNPITTAIERSFLANQFIHSGGLGAHYICVCGFNQREPNFVDRWNNGYSDRDGLAGPRSQSFDSNHNTSRGAWHPYATPTPSSHGAEDRVLAWGFGVVIATCPCGSPRT